MALNVQHKHSIRAFRAARAQRRLEAVLALTAVYMVAEAAAGLWTGSLALLADASHMLADVAGLVMAVLAVRFAQRPATPERTYGFHRTEILAALANGLLLLGIAGGIVVEAWRRAHEPGDIATLPMLLVALGGLAVNLVALRLLHRGARESLNVRAAALEVLSDLLGSVGVILAALVIALTGWQLADALVSVGIALFILPRAWRLLKTTLDVLLESTPEHIDLRLVEATMRAVPGVADVHDLHVWMITSGFVAMSGHVEAADRPSGEVLHDLQVALRERFGIDHTTLQVEQADHVVDGTCCTVESRCAVVGEGSRSA